MGKILSQLVVTGSEKLGKRRKLQHGGREWVTLIQGVGATGRVIPPFLPFGGKVLISNWFTEDLPQDWVIQVSPMPVFGASGTSLASCTVSQCARVS